MAAELMACQVSRYRAYHTFPAILIFVKNVFFSHNSGSRYARRTIKGFKDADDHLVSKKILNQKNGSLAWRTGPDNCHQNGKTCTHCGVTNRKPQ